MKFFFLVLCIVGAGKKNNSFIPYLKYRRVPRLNFFLLLICYGHKYRLFAWLLLIGFTQKWTALKKLSMFKIIFIKRYISLKSSNKKLKNSHLIVSASCVLRCSQQSKMPYWWEYTYTCTYLLHWYLNLFRYVLYFTLFLHLL